MNRQVCVLNSGSAVRLAARIDSRRDALVETRLQVVLAQIVRLLGLYQLLLHLRLPHNGTALCWPYASCEHSVALTARGIPRQLILRCPVIVSLFSGC
jgi:hypothetical protein